MEEVERAATRTTSASASTTCLPALAVATAAMSSVAPTTSLELSHGASSVVVETDVVAGKLTVAPWARMSASAEPRPKPAAVALDLHTGKSADREEGAPAAS
ncbi:hypothetical protein GUJ93_ZPchr0010g7210 [Zizania palustris]|uniref:Uncharacterized protein n=1 Tax=Zizania palustris TaxID=103762 RepID=A0A8J5WEX6_ZIZPA|nr:hypothetical protein GUJ93_ZPchr0010g7210 [Zizania palustris]